MGKQCGYCEVEIDFFKINIGLVLVFNGPGSIQGSSISDL